MGGRQRILDGAVVRVQRSGRQLQHRSVARHPELRDEQQPSIGIERSHDDRAWMDDDVADGLGAIAADDAICLEDHVVAGMERLTIHHPLL